MPRAEVCQLLEWDTDFFGFRVARVCGCRLTPEEADGVIDWCRAGRGMRVFVGRRRPPPHPVPGRETWL